MKYTIRFLNYSLFFLILFFTSCKKNSISTLDASESISSHLYPRLFCCLNWEESIPDNGVVLKLQPLSNGELNAINIIAIHKHDCYDEPDFIHGGYIHICTDYWLDIPKENTNTHQLLFYRIENNAIIIHKRSTSYSGYYITAIEKVKVTFQ